MANYEHAGAVMQAFRKQAKLSQKALAAKTQLVDEKGIGISETALSLIEHGKRLLSPKYLRLIHAAGYSPQLKCRRYVTMPLQIWFGKTLRMSRLESVST